MIPGSAIGSQKANNIAPGSGDKVAANTAMVKNYFAYHGGGKEPNEALEKYVEEKATSTVAKSTFQRRRASRSSSTGRRATSTARASIATT